MAANEDLNDMTLLQLLQSFPDPPNTVYIDPSYFPAPKEKEKESKLPPRASVMISSPTPNGPPTGMSTFSLASPLSSSSPSPPFSPPTSPVHSPPAMGGHKWVSPSLTQSSNLPSSNGREFSPPLAHHSHPFIAQPLRASAPVFASPPQPDTIEFISKGCKGELQVQDMQKMNDILIEMTPENLSNTLEKCYDNQRQNSSKSKLKNIMNKDEQAFLKISKHLLDFNYGDGKLCPLDTDLNDEIVITNIGSKKAKFKVSPVPPSTTHILTINPKDGILKKKQTMPIQFKLKVRTTTKLRKVITIEVEGGCKYFVVISVDSEKSVFGVTVDELACIEDLGVKIPAVLATLRNYLYAHNGLRGEGVFRVQGDEKELQRIKNQLNKGTFTETTDINCIASLIKLWYRELPQPILNIPVDTLRNIEAESECVDVYNELPEPNKSLMTWLMDVMADAANEEAYNKMSSRNFAICVAPNLFTSTGTNPADSLFLSSKVVHFVSQILSYRLRLKYPR